MYLIYALAGGKVTLNLAGAEGTFQADWVNPETGELTPVGQVQGGKPLAVSSPTGSDWFLWIR